MVRDVSVREQAVHLKALSPTAHVFVPRGPLHASRKPEVVKLQRRKRLTSSSHIEELPAELHLKSCAHLASKDLVAFSQASRTLRRVVCSVVIPERLAPVVKQYKTCLHALQARSAPLQLLYTDDVASSHATNRFSGATEAQWTRTTMPIIKADQDKFVLATGSELWTSRRHAPWHVVNMGRPGLQDITAVALTDVADDVILGFADGYRCRLQLSADSTKPHTLLQVLPKLGLTVQSLDYDATSNSLLTAYKAGYRQSSVVLNDHQSFLPGKIWTAKLLDRDTFATGMKGSSPLTVYRAASDGLLRPIWQAEGDKITQRSCLAIERLSPHLLLTGWFDTFGTVVWDIRVKAATGPVFSLTVPYDPSPHTCLATIQHDAGYYVFSGSNVNQVVHKFDLRRTRTPLQQISTEWSQSPDASCSIFAGSVANDAHSRHGPVYSIVAEYEKVFVATERRLLSFDFAARGDSGGEAVKSLNHKTGMLQTSWDRLAA